MAKYTEADMQEMRRTITLQYQELMLKKDQTLQVSILLALVTFFPYIGPILDDRLNEKLLKPWKGALSSHFRVSVRPSVDGLQGTPFGLGT